MRACIIWILLIGFTQLMGQEKLVFEKTTHDFGRLNEVNEKAEINFNFINGGDSSIQISEVKATCGCMTPFWSSEPIMSGDTGTITVAYSLVNRPGPFTKSVHVISNGNTQTLTISGHVTPISKSIEVELPAQFGALRMKHRSINMGKITTEKVVLKMFDVFNDSDSLILFDTAQIVFPDHLKLTFDPVELPAQRRGVIKVSYDPNLKNQLGYQYDQLTLITNDSIDPKKEIQVIATIEEYFPSMTEEELSHGPRLFVTNKILKAGNVKEGDTLKTQFILKNVGNQVLLIRDTQPNCECLKVVLEQMIIEPNQEITLFLDFNTAGRIGKQYKNVTIFTNDPRAPAQIVTIRADVRENTN